MIYVVRHGQTDWNLEGRFQGRIDIPLNEKGKSQAKKTKEKLEGIKFDKVFSSPLKRALETAKIITDEPIDIDDRIIERCNGQLEGKLKTECENMVDFTDENEVKLGIESLPDFRGRITSFFDELCEKYVGKDVLVVTHAGVSIYVRCYFEGEPKDGNYNNYKLKNCEVLQYDNSRKMEKIIKDDFER
jgi:broad specificity phosphatase PhoE